MSTPSSFHANPARAPFVVSFLGPLMRRLLRIGLPLGPNVLLTVRGRKSGELRTFPVAIVEHDGRRFVQSPFGEVNWVRNLREAREAVISKGVEQEAVTARPLPSAEAGPMLRATLSPYLNSRLIGWFARSYFDIRADSSAEEFIAKARRQPMFELRPRDPR